MFCNFENSIQVQGKVEKEVCMDKIRLMSFLSSNKNYMCKNHFEDVDGTKLGR